MPDGSRVGVQVNDPGKVAAPELDAALNPPKSGNPFMDKRGVRTW